MASGTHDQSQAASRALPVESLLSVDPLIIRRRIAFGDCDIVHTPRCLDPISVSACDLFMAQLVGLFGNRDRPVAGFDFPGKAVQLVFNQPMRVNELIDIHVYCCHIGRTTFDIQLDAIGGDQRNRFECVVTMICIETANYTAQPLPPYLVDRLIAHRRGA